MISAFAKGYQVLEEPRYLAAAQRAATFICSRLYDSSDGRLSRRHREGETAISGNLDDYAFFIQALLDLYTVRQSFGGGQEGLDRFAGLRVTIVGDIRHSRVARSQISAYAALGAEVTLVAPATLLPPSLEGWPVASVSHDLDSVLATTDVISLLRLQAERGSGDYVPTMREYTMGYALTARRALQLPPEAVILHPGPMVRGVEIASEVAELPSARITDQVGNGVAVRMAVLFLLLGQGAREADLNE